MTPFPLLLRQGGTPNPTPAPVDPLPARPRTAGGVLLSILPPVVLVAAAVSTVLVVRARRRRRADHSGAGGCRHKDDAAADATAAAAAADGRLRWRDGPPRENPDAARLEAFAAAAAAAARGDGLSRLLPAILLPAWAVTVAGCVERPLTLLAGSRLLPTLSPPPGAQPPPLPVDARPSLAVEAWSLPPDAPPSSLLAPDEVLLPRVSDRLSVPLL